MQNDDGGPIGSVARQSRSTCRGCAERHIDTLQPGRADREYDSRIRCDSFAQCVASEEPLQFWETGVVEKAFAVATAGYKPYAKSVDLVTRLVTARDACFPGFELIDRSKIGTALNDLAKGHAANTLTSLKVHTKARVSRLVYLRSRIPTDEFDALTAEERKIRSEEIKLACGDAIAPPYDPTRYSELVDLVEEVRALIDIDSWAWYKPLPPNAPPDSEPERRELLDCVEADPMIVVKAMHRIDMELQNAGAKTFTLVPLRTSFVPRFVHVTQTGLSDMGLLDTGDCNQATLHNRLRKNAEVHNEGSTGIDKRLKELQKKIKSIDKQLKTRPTPTLEAERKQLATQRAKLTKERGFALCPSKLELKRVREAHNEECKLEKQRRIDENLAIREGSKPKPSKEAIAAAKEVSERRKREREAEIDAINARITVEDTGGAAALEAKADAFAQVIRLPKKLVKAFGSAKSNKVSFADGFSTDGYSIRIRINKKATHSDADDTLRERDTESQPPPKKSKVSKPVPTRLPKRGIIGVEEMAKLVAKSAKGRVSKGELVDGMMRDRSPKEQNDYMNEMLQKAFGGECPICVVGCDPGKRELAVLVDPDMFGMSKDLRPVDRVWMTRYTSDQRRHDYTPGRYGLRRKQRLDEKNANRIKRASMAAEYRDTIAKPAYVLEAEQSIVASAHANGSVVPSKASPTLERFVVWVQAREAIRSTVQPYYEGMLQRKLRWKKHIEQERSIACFVNRIKELEKQTGKQMVIAWGGWGKSAGRPGQACNKGSAPALGVGLLEKVAQHFLVIVVPEGYSTKTCYHCGGHASRCVEVEEARRPHRDQVVLKKLTKALESAGDDTEAIAKAQERYNRIVSHRPHVRGIRCCEGCGLRLSRDKNGAANIGLTGKRFLLGVGTFRVLISDRQRALEKAGANA